MNAYHGMLVHFPMALLLLASVLILIQIWLKQMNSYLMSVRLLLLLGLLSGILSIVIGFMIWPMEAYLHSPNARNHILATACSMFGYLMLYFIYRANIKPGDLASKLILSLYVLTVSFLLILTGTLGGNLAGNPSGLPALLKSLGWDLNYTMYLSNIGLALTMLISLIIIASSFMGSKNKGARNV